ncbi:type 2 periplasmic-binding domain-containing protein [Algoriphagus litoralis]|uniref:ABC transporter substrate-binding protein n=1 Tax=Algoriphagus litoralis TaxID=2202829 RepID=UPI000DBA27CF|nr:ABC transporter substrate-binding protein [Algoriphagus litoralis]
MKTLRIVGVPEHFNYPFRLLEQSQPFQEKGIEIQWIDESRGSGQMNLALRNDEADIAILLTESFLKDFEAGNPSKMIGYHVETPLTWGVHLGASTSVSNLEKLEKKHFLVSRMGSGSHLMAMVLANREKWNLDELTFELVGNMDGAKEAMDNGNEGMFLWEKYTTAPMVKNGTMNRIGEVQSPWPCFIMVASEKALADWGNSIFEVRDQVYSIAETFSDHPNRAEVLSDFYQLDRDDVGEWLKQTSWCTSNEISRAKLNSIMQTMRTLGIIKEILSPELFLATEGLTFHD